MKRRRAAPRSPSANVLSRNTPLQTYAQIIKSIASSEPGEKPVCKSINGNDVIVHSPDNNPWYEVIGGKFNFSFSCIVPMEGSAKGSRTSSSGEGSKIPWKAPNMA